MLPSKSAAAHLMGISSIFEVAINGTQKRITNLIFMPSKLFRIGIAHLEPKQRQRFRKNFFLMKKNSEKINFCRFFFIRKVHLF